MLARRLVPALLVLVLVSAAGARAQVAADARAVDAAAAAKNAPPRAELPALRKDEVVAGSPGDFMEVCHVVLAGSDFEIGRALGTLAKERYASVPTKAEDPVRARAQRRFMQAQFPALLERARGAAAAFGVPLDDAHDWTGIADSFRRSGCSVVFFPPESTDDGAGLMSRFYDFGTGTFEGTKPKPDQRPTTSRPMVLELHPEHGFASLSLCAYDLLGGVIDGVNSAGLCVALLAVDEQEQARAVEVEGPAQVGFGVLTTLRLLLDTCADVAAAKQALLTTKQVYEMIPCHYMVCDANGESFIWERSFAGNHDWIFDGDGTPQIVTNYAIHRHPDPGKLPREGDPLGACNRARLLADQIAAHAAKFSLDQVKRLHSAVACAPPAAPTRTNGVTSRTLWHALYVPEERSLEIDFYLHDERDPAAPGGTRVVRSEYRKFTLGGTR